MEGDKCKSYADCPVLASAVALQQRRNSSGADERNVFLVSSPSFPFFLLFLIRKERESAAAVAAAATDAVGILRVKRSNRK